MLSSDVNHPSVPQNGSCSAITIEGPNRPFFSRGNGVSTEVNVSCREVAGRGRQAAQQLFTLPPAATAVTTRHHPLQAGRDAAKKGKKEAMNENDRFKPSPNSSQSSNNDPSAKAEKDYPNFELIYVPGDRFAHLY